MRIDICLKLIVVKYGMEYVFILPLRDTSVSLYKMLSLTFVCIWMGVSCIIGLL